jgi:hypothetical protein
MAPCCQVPSEDALTECGEAASGVVDVVLKFDLPPGCPEEVAKRST